MYVARTLPGYKHTKSSGIIPPFTEVIFRLVVFGATHGLNPEISRVEGTYTCVFGGIISLLC